MTNEIVPPSVNWTDKRRTQDSDVTHVGTPANYASNATLDARLLAIGGVYTQKYIDSMTQNDKIYAVRLNDDAASL